MCCKLQQEQDQKQQREQTRSAKREAREEEEEERSIRRPAPRAALLAYTRPSATSPNARDETDDSGKRRAG